MSTANHKNKACRQTTRQKLHTPVPRRKQTIMFKACERYHKIIPAKECVGVENDWLHIVPTLPPAYPTSPSLCPTPKIVCTAMVNCTLKRRVIRIDSKSKTNRCLEATVIRSDAMPTKSAQNLWQKAVWILVPFYRAQLSRVRTLDVPTGSFETS